MPVCHGHLPNDQSASSRMDLHNTILLKMCRKNIKNGGHTLTVY
jgi:hypothetical protein